MKHTTSQVIYSYWNEVRAGRPAPRRFDIEPSRISHILAETLILERVDFETYRFRLAGTKVCEHFGRELRGAGLFELWDNETDRITLERHLSAIVRQCHVGVFSFTARSSDGHAAAFEMILLPLLHTRDTVDRCLGAISIAYPGVPDGVILSDHEIVSSDLIKNDCNQLSPQEPDRQSPFRQDVRSARIVRSERRQFRVYDGGLAGQAKPNT